jgi:hypothetical protein
VILSSDLRSILHDVSEKTLALGSSVNRGNSSHFGANPPPRIAPRLIYLLFAVWYICD